MKHSVLPLRNRETGSDFHILHNTEVTKTHSFFRVFMFQSCRFPSEKPTARWLVREMNCTAVAPTPLAPLSCRQRCRPCLVLTSLSRGISPGDLVTTCRSARKDQDKE